MFGTLLALTDFYKELGCIIVLFYGRGNKHEKVQLIVWICIARVWWSLDPQPTILITGPSPPSILCSWLLVIRSCHHSSQLILLSGEYLLPSVKVFLAVTVSRFWTVTFTGVSLLERFSNSWPWMVSNPPNTITSLLHLQSMTWWLAERKCSGSIYGTNNEQRMRKVRNDSIRDL